jgi:hypothetical protein
MSNIANWTRRLNSEIPRHGPRHPCSNDCPVCSANFRASAKDFHWFVKHPHRTYRLRRAKPGEFVKAPAPAPHVYTVVRQLIAGDPDPRARLRLVVATDRPFTDRSEQAACDLWHEGAKLLLDPEVVAFFDAAERQGRAVQ